MNTETPTQCAVPLTELLRAVPIGATDWFEEPGIVGSRHIPFGKYCHEAADRIDKLERDLAAANDKLRTVEAQNQRLLSLVRLCRGELHEQNAITDKEYADLVQQSELRVMLETHDDLRETNDKLERERAACVEALTRMKTDHRKMDESDMRSLLERFNLIIEETLAALKP